MQRIRSILLGAMLLVLAAAAGVEAREGFYVGFGALYETISGDLDGSVGLAEGTRPVRLPEIDNAFGFDVRAGYEMAGQWAFELDLLRIVHTGTWAGQRGDVTHTGLNINGKCGFRKRQVVQPFVLLGVSMNQLLIENGSIDPVTGAPGGDARLRGPGLNAGFGADTYLGQSVSLAMGFTYRYVDYAKETNHNKNTKPKNTSGINGSGFDLGLNVAYHF